MIYDSAIDQLATARGRAAEEGPGILHFSGGILALPSDTQALTIFSGACQKMPRVSMIKRA